jgi:hypothetical protein
MFYRKEDVDEAIICGICNSTYKSPRVLPCSESACHECIQFIIQTDPNQEFACNFCHKKHKPFGKDGFPLNGALIKLLKAKAVNIYRNDRVEELKEKLAEIKSKCEQFKLNLDNDVDQVEKRCIRLRNQVHLETDVLIEEVHNFNASLIAEIDKYEQECIASINSNTKENKFNKFFDELENFCTDKMKYLTEFKLDEKVVKETTTVADSYLEKLKIDGVLLKNTLFNRKEAEFIKRHNKINRTLLGTLVFRSSSLDFTHLNEVKFTNNIITGLSSDLIVNLFKNHDENNFVFYKNNDGHLNATCFDKIGNVLYKITNVCGMTGSSFSDDLSCYRVTRSLNNFILFVLIPTARPIRAICGHQIYNNQGITGLFFILDQDLNYIKHNADFRDVFLLHMAANSSRVICIDCYNYYLLDMNLASVNIGSMNKIKYQVGDIHDIINVQINDEYLFFLCKNKKVKNFETKSFQRAEQIEIVENKMKIFEIESGDLVVEIETSANQMKLLSADRLVLFDSVSRIVSLYEQTGEFCKLEDINLEKSLESGLKINLDQSNCLVFYNSKYMKYTSMN